MSRPNPKYDIEITLPAHDHVKKPVTCYICHGEMLPYTGSEIFHLDGKRVQVSNIKFHHCPKCKESVYSATEAGLIEEAVYGIR